MRAARIAPQTFPTNLYFFIGAPRLIFSLMILPEKKLSTGRAQGESMARPITRRLEQPPNTSTNLHCIGATSDICPDVCLQENGRTCERCCEFCTINGPIKVIEFCMAKNSHFYFIFCTFGASQLACWLTCLFGNKEDREKEYRS